MMRIGVLSDTHGLLRPQALTFLSGCELIVHGGDIGDPAILARLASLARVVAVRGNNDVGPWADALPSTEQFSLGAHSLCLVHDLAGLDIDPVAAGVRVVIHGHSHRPSILERSGVLYVNPGSAGPRRFRLPISAAELTVDGDVLGARVSEL